jgi:hypothetical protein
VPFAKTPELICQYQSAYRLFSQSRRASGSWVLCRFWAVAEFALNRHISKRCHRVIKFSVQVNLVDHQAGAIGPELADDYAVRLDETRWIRRIVAARIRTAQPEIVRRRPTLHRLTHYVSMHTWARLPGIIKRLKDAIYSLLIQAPIYFRKAEVKTYQQRTSHTINVKIHRSAARGVMVQVAGGAEPLVVTVHDFAFGAYQIQAVVRLIRPGQSVRTAQYNPNTEFLCKSNNLFGFFYEQVPIEPLV